MTDLSDSCPTIPDTDESQPTPPTEVSTTGAAAYAYDIVSKYPASLTSTPSPVLGEYTSDDVTFTLRAARAYSLTARPPLRTRQLRRIHRRAIAAGYANNGLGHGAMSLRAFALEVASGSPNVLPRHPSDPEGFPSFAQVAARHFLKVKSPAMSTHYSEVR